VAQLPPSRGKNMELNQKADKEKNCYEYCHLNNISYKIP